MEVRPAEAERGKGCPAWMLWLTEPRAHGGVHAERAVRHHQRIDRFCHLKRRRKHLVVKRHGHLDERCSTCRSLGVADHRLHRADGHLAGGNTGVDIGKCRGFRRISHLGAGAVGLDQLHRSWINPAAGIGIPQASFLSLGTRCIDGVAFAVATGAHALDDSVDRVASFFSVAQSLQYHHAEAFAEDGAVSVGIEGLRITTCGQRRCLAETHEHEDVVERVHPACYHDIRLAGLQFHRRQVYGTEAGGTRRIHHAVGAVQVEPVGDPPGHHVAQKTGEAVLLPRDVALGDPFDHILGHVVRHATVLECFPPVRMPQPCTQRDDQFQRTGHAEDDGNLGSIHTLRLRFVEDDASVRQRLFRGNQTQELRGIRGLKVTWGDTEFQRIEVVGFEETPALGIREVRLLGVGIEVVRRVPMRRRHSSDAVHAVLDVGPVRTGAVGLGE